jgi:hypothetical protein
MNDPLTELIADVQFAADVAALHRRGPYALLDMLVELACERLLRVELEERVRRWARVPR